MTAVTASQRRWEARWGVNEPNAVRRVLLAESLIREGGAKAGVVLNPATHLDVLDYVLEKVDFVLMVTVNPGFAGQKVISATLRKIADCRRYLGAREFTETPIQ